MKLTQEQLDILQSEGNLYVRACPGAGKTRTLVEFAIRITEGVPRLGVAFLSFTNAAASEVRGRLAMKAPRLLRPPHFVGTFDSFLIRHVLGPDGLEHAPGTRVQFRESWGERIGFRAVKGGVSLDLFVPDGNGVRLDDTRAGQDYPARAALRSMTDATRQTLEGLAQRRIDTALRRGGATAPFLRAQAARRLTDGVTAERAAARFAVVLVDEAQDCDALDLQIVTSLRNAGCRCIVVADPEQGIFGFRGADPMALGALGHAELPLTGNFRSTASICAASATLRVSALPPDTPMDGERQDRPVALLAYEGQVGNHVGEAFLRLLRDHRIGAADAVVVAHQQEVAHSAVGVTAVRGSNSQGAVIARAVAPTASTDDRNEAVELIVEVLSASLGNVANSVATSRWCNTTARQVLGMAAFGDSACGPCKRIRDALALIRPLDAMPFAEVPHKRFRAQDQKVPENAGASTSPPSVACSTVHGVKGREFDAVLVIIPDSPRLPGLIDAWRQRDASHEGRAVVYVAATRARKLLAFAVPRNASAEVALLLRSQGATVVEMDC